MSRLFTQPQTPKELADLVMSQIDGLQPDVRALVNEYGYARVLDISVLIRVRLDIPVKPGDVEVLAATLEFNRGREQEAILAEAAKG